MVMYNTILFFNLFFGILKFGNFKNIFVTYMKNLYGNFKIVVVGLLRHIYIASVKPAHLS